MNTKSIAIGVVVLASVVFLIAPRPPVEDPIGPSFKQVEASELSQMLESKDFKLIDVHIPEQQHIPGTDAFIPYTDISSLQEEIGGLDEKVVLYCRSGSMSLDAAEKLVELGYTNVIDLAGGLNSWKAQGLETVNQVNSDSSSEATYTTSEIAKHNTFEDCWSTRNNFVYNIPISWIEEHPGGREVFSQVCGKDMTEIFKVHVTEKPEEILSQYLIGKLVK